MGIRARRLSKENIASSQTKIIRCVYFICIQGVGAVAIAEPHRLIGAEAVAAFLGVPLAAAPAQAASLSAGEIAMSERGALAEVVCRP